MADELILLFIIFILIIGIVFYWEGACAIATVVGGSILMPDNAKLIFDGHNLIHGLSGKSAITLEEFEQNLKDISKVISKALPQNDLHIIIKNPGEELTERFNKKYAEESVKNKSKKKLTAEEKIPYFKQLVEISKQYPKITYHLAYGKEPKQDRSHYLKGRDDVLVIYLAKPDGYIVSMDRFKDFSQFSKVKPFKHFSVINGSIQPKENIKPQDLVPYLKSPNVGNHLRYEFVDNQKLKKLGIKNGEIHIGERGYSYLYLLM